MRARLLLTAAMLTWAALCVSCRGLRLHHRLTGEPPPVHEEYKGPVTSRRLR